MRFTQIDKIVALEPGSRITAVKALSLGEEYLRDHFPLFPVMPGVLMLEAMYQAGMWLVHRSEDFAHSMVVLKQARNIKYADFVEPGRTLTITAEITSQDETETLLKARGVVEGREKPAVMGRMVIERYNLADRRPEMAPIDMHARTELRNIFNRLSDLPQ